MMSPEADAVWSATPTTFCEFAPAGPIVFEPDTSTSWPAVTAADTAIETLWPGP